MNRLAVALAADSAVTVQTGQRNKIYNTANKLFMLSRRRPVGIMVYNNGSLLGVPWETLIKVFRAQFDEQELPTLEEYAEAFIAFVEGRTDLFTAEVQTRYFLDMVEANFVELSRSISRHVDQAEAKADAKTDRAALRKRLVADEIRELHGEWAALDLSRTVPPGSGDSLRGQCSGEISTLVTKYFRSRSWVVEQDEVRLLTELAGFWVDRDSVPEVSFTGVVVAGFGRDDYFPVIRSYGVGEVYGNRLKIDDVETIRISDDQPVHIGVYADSDMSNVFLNGLSPEVETDVIERAYAAAEELTQTALANCPDESLRSSMEAALTSARDDLMERFVDELEESKRNRSEFENALIHVPKDELASVARSLVNLNSFKKRMSMSLETVGGAVDVAVISKGDGFIWIDRKHYFDAALNPHFVHNRFPNALPPRKAEDD
jgi:hypothetical protein